MGTKRNRLERDHWCTVAGTHLFWPSTWSVVLLGAMLWWNIQFFKFYHRTRVVQPLEDFIVEFSIECLSLYHKFTVNHIFSVKEHNELRLNPQLFYPCFFRARRLISKSFVALAFRFRIILKIHVSTPPIALSKNSGSIS